ncbi:MAG: alkene reductase [Leptothrix ochracea]|uniref:alkene reductase n=1 Tax=Leptothrix ochracea TaxID=735331 RepID=UPI0034E2A14D
MTDKLLSPVRLGALELKNRVVMAPLTRCRAINPGTVPNELMVRYYTQRASAGLIISEGTLVSPQGRGYPFTPGIWSEEQVAGWRLVTEAVHAQGGKIVCQLWHCGRLSLPQYHDGQPPVSASAINPEIKMFNGAGLSDTVTPRALSVEDIQVVVADFGRAAKNAIDAGFDGVEVHSSNGYLFHQFFSACSNTRTDAYGGSFENRARIFFDVLDAIAKVMPFDRVGFRLNPMMNGMHGMTVDADTVAMWEHVVRGANRYGLAYLHLTEVMDPKQIEGNLHALAQVSAHFRPIAHMPLISNGRFDQAKSEQFLDAGLCDAVAFGVPWIANPDLVERFARKAPLNAADPSTFYMGGEKGYVDYPALDPSLMA